MSVPSRPVTEQEASNLSRLVFRAGSRWSWGCSMRMRSNVLAFCCLAACNLQAASSFPPECPQRGTLQIQKDPAAWADQCFAAINGRLPQADRIGKADSAMRDVDLDGVDERLEIRGVGNPTKQIYVYRSAADGLSTIRIQYRDGLYVETGSDQDH